jgi:hypothetical protein
VDPREHPGHTVTLGDVREHLSALASYDVGEVQAFLVVTYDTGQNMLIFGYPGCQPCRVGFLAEALTRIARDMPHQGDLHFDGQLAGQDGR